MHDVSHDSEGCVDDPQYDPKYCGFNDSPGCIPLKGCGNMGIYPFLMIFIMTIFLVFLNIFVGIVVFEWKNVKHAPIKKSDLDIFTAHWQKYDPHAIGYIDFLLLEEFVRTLPCPFGFGNRPYTSSQLNQRIGTCIKNVDFLHSCF